MHPPNLIYSFRRYKGGVAAGRYDDTFGDYSQPEDILRPPATSWMGAMLDPRTAASLLDEFRVLPGRIARPQTFMEIGGYPHYENVCSNFLAFFLDPEGPHGLGSLFLDALMGSMGVAGVEGSLEGSVSVEREVVTEAGNRIDVLITSASHAALIENKIFAAVANPFEDYSAYLDRLKTGSEDAYQDDNKVKVLLTLYPSAEGEEWGFRNLTHADFAGEVRSRLVHHVSEADARYLTLMLDFLNTLENLGEGTRMNQEYIKLLAKRSEVVKGFLDAVSEVRGELRDKVQRLVSLINVEINQDVKIDQIPWKPNRYSSLEHYLQHRVHIDAESYIVVEPVISPKGWEFHIFRRVSSKSHSSTELQKLLDEKGIPPEAEQIVHEKRFEFEEEDLGGIAALVEEELTREAAIARQIRDKVPRSAG